MKTNLLKKGKVAIAWAVSLAMVFATVSYPVSVAKAETVEPTTPVVEELSDSQTPSESGTYPLPAGFNFVYIKQANDSNVLWTLTDLSSLWGNDKIINLGSVVEDKDKGITKFDLIFDGSDYTALKAFFGEFWDKDYLNPSSDLKDPEIDYIWGIENSPFVFNEGEPGEYQYEFTLEDDVITFYYDKDKVSHFYSGRYDVPEEDYEINVSKIVTLNGEDDPAEFPDEFIGKTINVILYEDGVKFAEKTITYSKTGPNTVTFTGIDKDKEYTVAEVDDNGEAIEEGSLFWGYTLEDIEYSEVDWDGTEGYLEITNNLVEEEEELGEIVVTKKVVVINYEKPTFDGKFHIALFEVTDGNELELVETQDVEYTDEPVEDLLKGKTVTFKGLELDKTYAVYETDEANNIIDPKKDLPDGPWIGLYYNNDEKELDGVKIELTSGEDGQKTGTATVTNLFDPGEFPYNGEIVVEKTATLNGSPTTRDDTYYVALFGNPELTTRLTDAMPLDLKGKPAGVAATYTFTELQADMTYYVAETDKDGKPLSDKVDKIGFEIVFLPGTGVTVNADKDYAAAIVTDEGTVVKLVNQYKKVEEPLTGDSTNMNLWLFLAVLGVAGAIAPFALRKREEIND